MLRTIIASAVAALVLGSTAAQAAQIRFNTLDARWQGTVGGANVVYTPAAPGFGDPATVYWGTGDRSGYEFDATDPVPVIVNDGQVFDLGVFTHRNQPITAGTSITGTTLNLQMALEATDINNNFQPVGTLNFLFDFAHWETPNGDNPCANGLANYTGVNINGCADQVTFKTSSLTDTFKLVTSAGEVDYTLTLTGFCQGVPCTPVDKFWTKEEWTNSAVLKASFDVAEKPTIVPLPPAVLLFGSALAGLAGLSRRGKEKQAA
jgi:hypothetical protein